MEPYSYCAKDIVTKTYPPLSAYRILFLLLLFTSILILSATPSDITDMSYRGLPPKFNLPPSSTLISASASLERSKMNSIIRFPDYYSKLSGAQTCSFIRNKSCFVTTPHYDLSVRMNCLQKKNYILRANSRFNSDDIDTNINTGITNENNPDILAIQQQMNALQHKANSLNNKFTINLNSPKQISQALFPTEYYQEPNIRKNDRVDSSNLNIVSTSKSALQSLIDRDTIENDFHAYQRDLANLVLRYRKLKSTLQYKQRDHGVQDEIALQPRQPRTSTNFPQTTYNQTQQIQQKQSFLNVIRTIHSIQNYESDDDTNNTPNQSQQRISNIPINERSQQLTEVDLYWQNAIRNIQKPSARSLLLQLHPECPMGFNPQATPFNTKDMNINDSNYMENIAINTSQQNNIKGGSLLSFVREQKLKYPDCVILTRVGEFYESYGLDAILLVEHCGLNPMAGKARAGCPVRNIQPTLDCLTNAGFRVAVYEEVNEYLSPNSKSRIKNRMLAQIISSASPTYLYDLVLDDNSSTTDALFSTQTPLARPYVGVIHTSSGYTLVQVNLEERTVMISDRLTPEAVQCALAWYPPTEPLIYFPSPSEEASPSLSLISSKLAFVPSKSDAIDSFSMRNNNGSKAFQVKVMSSLLDIPASNKGLSDFDRYKQGVINAILKLNDVHHIMNIESRRNPSDSNQIGNHLSHDDFVLLPRTSMNIQGTVVPHPLHLETATQLGLMSNPTIPSLVDYLVSDNAPSYTRRFLRRWLLTPPEPSISNSMYNLVKFMKENDNISLPPMIVPHIGKVLSLIRAGQASSQVFRDILSSMSSLVSILDNHQTNDESFIQPLMALLRHESGIDAQPDNLRQRCLDATQVIQEVINTDIYQGGDSSCNDYISNFDDVIPSAFFERNEVSWRFRVRPDAAKDAYTNVEIASKRLAEAVASDFWGADDISLSNARESKNQLVQDIFNNLIAIREIPSWVMKEKGAEMYYHPRDRNGKMLRNRYTTKKVEEALSEYVDACESASSAVTHVLMLLSETLCDTGQLPAISQAIHSNLILSTVVNHAAHSNFLGWNLAESSDTGPTISLQDGSTKNIAASFHSLWPYWMDRSEAVLNSFDLNGLFLLTAPNMSGKSTVMRSTAAAALLTTCGFCAPVGQGTIIRRFDSIFVRGASSDVPTENKSAFGAEMEDVSAMLKCCGEKSLVFVDELGRGTSPKDGTCLAGAILESMASKGMSGIFATHLHQILDLPLVEEANMHIVKKRMDMEDVYASDGVKTNVKWTYQIVDGVCTNSLALVTAASFGIPDSILKRAQDFYPSIHMVMENHLDQENTVATDENWQIVENSMTNDSSMTLDHALEIMEQIVENETNKAVRIYPRWTPSPSLEGNSCVYVLHIGKKFYVGETDTISKRFREHRSKGGYWAGMDAIAIKLNGGKSEARNVESRLIRKLASLGFDLISISDGRRIRPLR